MEFPERTEEQNAKAEAILDRIQVDETEDQLEATPELEYEGEAEQVAPEEGGDTVVEEEAAPEAETATESDPWADIQGKFTPEQIAQMESDLENQKAMASESHRRNEDAARDRAAAQEARVFMETVSRMPPDKAAEFIQLYKNPQQAQAPAVPEILQHIDQEDPMAQAVGALSQQIQQLQADQQQNQFQATQRDVATHIEQAIKSDDLFEEMGLGDVVRQRVNARLWDPSEGVTPETVSQKAAEFVAEERGRFSSIEQNAVQRFLERARQKQQNAPAPSKGPTQPKLSRPAPKVKKPKVEHMRDFAGMDKTRQYASAVMDRLGFPQT